AHVKGAGRVRRKGRVGEVGFGDLLQNVARFGPPEAEAASRRRQIYYMDGAVLGQVTPQPGEVVRASRAAGDDEKSLRAQPRNRQVADNAAAFVEQRCVTDAA